MRWRTVLVPFLAVAAPASAMTLGVNTHFDQNWPLAAFSQVDQSGAQGIRDAISWGKVERTAGHYDFTPANSGFADLACQRGLPLLLTLTPRSPTYDAGETVFSPEGRRAFAAFTVAVADRYPCLAAIEIGNEINDHSLKGRMTGDMPQSYVAIVREVNATLKARHPRVALLSGSSLSVATGFFGRLFSAGLLSLVDGIVVHPYLATPEQLPLQLDRLRALMKSAGQSRPIWASEFSFAYATPEDAPPHALKMITLLSAGHVERADWYALRNETWYPNMGLFAGQLPRPALDTFRTATSRLLPAGDARRIDGGDPLVQIYRFGDGPYVAWGAGRSIRWSEGAKAWDARGRPVPLPTNLGEQPVIVEAPKGFSLGSQTILADSLLDFGGADWRFSMGAQTGASSQLDWIDWNWTPYIGAQGAPNFRAMPNAVSVALRPNNPAQLVEHVAIRSPGPLWVIGCFGAKAEKPVHVTISANGQTLFSQSVSGLVQLPATALGTNSSALEIRYAGTTSGAALLRRRIQLTRQPGAAPLPCPPGRDTITRGQAPAE